MAQFIPHNSSAPNPCCPATDPSPTMPSDRDLLRRFVLDGDEIAFAGIVERHAGFVMSVCRRVVGQNADADDAFQATFFALSRRPSSVLEGNSLAGWLYSVAWRTSVRLVRHRKRIMMEALSEQVAAAEPDPLDQIAAANDLAALDEELHQLPERFRSVLVMSYFAHQTNQEIADQLNESKGAVDGRIRDARRMLRVRLARRGVQIGVLTVAGSLAKSTVSAATPQLIAATIQFGRFGTGCPGLENVSGVNLQHMQFLTSTGTSLMGIKTGTLLAAGLLVVSGVLGMARLTATTDDGNGRVDGSGSFDSASPDIALKDSGDEHADNSIVQAAGSIPASPDSPASGNASPPENQADYQSRIDYSPFVRVRKGAEAEFSRAEARAAERRIHEMIGTQKIPALDFGQNAALKEILAALETHFFESQGTRILIRLDEKSAELSENPEFLENTLVSGISFPEDSMSLASALDQIFAKVKDHELTWIVEDEIVLITTTADAEREDRLIIRSYDIRRLRAMCESLVLDDSPTPPQTGGGMFSLPQEGGGNLLPGSPAGGDPASVIPGTAGGGMAGAGGLGGYGGGLGGGGFGGYGGGTAAAGPKVPDTWQQRLIGIIQEMTSPPCLWTQKGDEIGTMSVAGHRLLVQQTRVGHEKVVEVLEELETAAEETAADESTAPRTIPQ